MSLHKAGWEARKEWQTARTSDPFSHGKCCEEAKAWLKSTGRSYDARLQKKSSVQAPRWLSDRYRWGPTRWPAAWCELVRAEEIDCGAFSAMARLLFRDQGCEAYAAQVLRPGMMTCTSHWSERWGRVPGAFPWIGEGIVYHEVCLVRTAEGQTGVFDPAEGYWIDPELVHGHYGHIAIRADVPMATPWGRHVLMNRQWTELAHAYS